MTDIRLTKVAADQVAPNRRRGGDIRVMLSPKTAGATSGFMGVAHLRPGEHFIEHYHPYSEEFLYLVHGRVSVLIERDQLIVLSPGEGLMVPKGARHRVANDGAEDASLVFHLSPLAPRPELGHVDTEDNPHTGAHPEVGTAHPTGPGAPAPVQAAGEAPAGSRR
ncbi:16.7 kDa protein in whiE locus [Sphaerisporangium krabiense]|uniref:Putative monooxygenase n=1 Tax=Sphaerisporangium krabiense TaxID=763782 RepID=A0A7W9DVE2_9ACTN|nr:cupin domain-containing protein [Sphaerisporangium krabiense]MBB5631375.1 putative monooxygenase [Sphaerisporangium krabiense]GII60792.1 16.7 kDa protein in whiE locus [Sphaerisporangium krabiense]